MRLYLVTAKINGVLEEGALIECTAINAEDISEALKLGASALGVTYDEVLSISVVKGV